MTTNKLPEAVLYKNGDKYLFCFSESVTDFTIPTIAEVLQCSKPQSKKPPTIFLIFRRPVQKALSALGFHYERKDISRISSALWKKVKSTDTELTSVFVTLCHDISLKWRRERLIMIEFLSPLQSTKSIDDGGGGDHGDDNDNRGGDNREKSKELEKAEEHNKIFVCSLSKDDERQISLELFTGLADCFELD